MNIFQKFICKLFHIETYEHKYESCKKQLHEVRENYDIALSLIECYKEEAVLDAREIERLEAIYEDPLKVINDEVNKIASIYQSCVDDLKYIISTHENLEHRAFAEGRAAAYAELGVWNIDAHECGDTLVMDRDGNVFELLTLEDVLEEAEFDEDINPESVTEQDMNVEINLDDLLDDEFCSDGEREEKR